jgi:hypothetical protein
MSILGMDPTQVNHPLLRPHVSAFFESQTKFRFIPVDQQLRERPQTSAMSPVDSRNCAQVADDNAEDVSQPASSQRVDLSLTQVLPVVPQVDALLSPAGYPQASSPAAQEIRHDLPVPLVVSAVSSATLMPTGVSQVTSSSCQVAPPIMIPCKRTRECGEDMENECDRPRKRQRVVPHVALEVPVVPQVPAPLYESAGCSKDLGGPQVQAPNEGPLIPVVPVVPAAFVSSEDTAGEALLNAPESLCMLSSGRKRKRVDVEDELTTRKRQRVSVVPAVPAANVSPQDTAAEALLKPSESLNTLSSGRKRKRVDVEDELKTRKRQRVESPPSTPTTPSPEIMETPSSHQATRIAPSSPQADPDLSPCEPAVSPAPKASQSRRRPKKAAPVEPRRTSPRAASLIAIRKIKELYGRQ